MNVMNKIAEETNYEPKEFSQPVGEGSLPKVASSDQRGETASVSEGEKENVDATAEAIEYVKQIIARQRAKAGESLAPAQEDASTIDLKADDEQTVSTSHSPGSSLLTDAPTSEPRAMLDSLGIASSVKERQNRQTIQPQDMERMREAANISTRIVLDSHEIQRIYRMMFAYIVLVVGSVSASLTLVSLARGTNEWGYTAAIVATAVAIYATWRFISLTSRLVKVKSQPNGQKKTR